MIFFFFIIIVINFFLIKYYKFFAKQINLFDYPAKRKIHKYPVPLLGGTFFILNILLYFILGSLLNVQDQFLFIKNQEKYLFLFFTFLVYIIGFIDDKIGISPNRRLLVLSLIFFLLLCIDDELIVNELNFLSFDRLISVGSYSYIFTILCFLIFINACNMFDGINLQASIYFIILLISLILITYFSIFLFVILIFLIFFLLLNRSGKIFFGDNGIYAIAFVISYIIIKNYNILNNINVEQILILMIYPGLDMLRIVIQRVLKKKHPFSGDKRHLHHLILEANGYKMAIFTISGMLLFTSLLIFLNINTLITIIFSIIIYLVVTFYYIR